MYDIQCVNNGYIAILDTDGYEIEANKYSKVYNIYLVKDSKKKMLEKYPVDNGDIIERLYYWEEKLPKTEHELFKYIEI